MEFPLVLKNFLYNKIWNNDKNKNDTSMLNAVNDLSFDSGIYKPHNV